MPNKKIFAFQILVMPVCHQQQLFAEKFQVVCFDATSPKDIVTHKVDGYKVESFKSGDSVVVAKKYIELYEEILK